MTVKEVVSDTKRLATFSHYVDGNLYYKVEVDGLSYQFPINVFDRSDIGTTTLVAQYRAIELMRYIRKAIESDNFTRTK